ncbi:MAG: protein kinase [Myxococcaceae bacterium]|nr:protein kinase [Myxococcaceae bacterium]
MNDDPQNRPTQLDDPYGATSIRRSDPNLPAVNEGEARPGAFTPPAQVGRFKLEKLLGRGGMAAVFLAREEGTGRLVALKLMDPNLRGDPSFVERFLHEAKSCASVKHPNVVEVYDYGDFQGWHYLACEFVDGGTVGSLLEAMGELPAALAAELLTQLLQGLSHAHDSGVVHRDLKPENLLLTSSGVLKIADFGIARSADNSKLTKTGMLVGTAGYMSPEQASGKKVDARSDLFSTGIILYEMLTGKNPFASDNPATSITRILTNSCPPIFEVKPTAPAELETMLERLLAYDADARFPSSRAAAEALMPYVAQRRSAQPMLVAECIKNPKDLKALLDSQSAIALVNEVRGDVEGNALQMNHAAIKLFFALQLDAGNREARMLLDYLGSKMRLNFGPPQNPKLVELEAQLERDPQNTLVLTQLAQLYKAEGNILRAAMYLRRYLRLKPTDSYVASQLNQLMGERSKPATLAGAPAVGTAVLPAPGPSTQDLVRGVKTGGMKAPRPSAPTGLSTQRPRSTEAVAGFDVVQVEAKDPRKAQFAKLGVIALVLLVAVLAFRKLTRSVDNVVQGSQETTEQLRARFDPGQPPPQVDPVAPSPGGTEPGAGGVAGGAEKAAALYNSALRAENTQDYRAALAQYEEVMREYPKRSQAESAAFHVGKVHLALSESTEALTAFDDFLQRYPGSTDATEALIRRGEVKAKLGRHEQAVTDYTAVLEQHAASPLVTEAYVLRGEARTALNDPQGARADFALAQSRCSPSDPWYKRAAVGLEVLPKP